MNSSVGTDSAMPTTLPSSSWSTLPKRPGALIRALRISRERWKTKYLDLKRDQKRLQNQVAAVRRSREQWQQKASTSEAEVLALRTRVEALEAQTAELRKELAAPREGEKKG